MHRAGENDMLKLIKYEFRKNLYGIAVMLSIIALAQIYFMYACFIDQNRNKALAGGYCSFALLCASLWYLRSELSHTAGNCRTRPAILCS